MLPPDWGDGYPNVWLGTTAEDQKHYDRRWSILRDIPAGCVSSATSLHLVRSKSLHAGPVVLIG